MARKVTKLHMTESNLSQFRCMYQRGELGEVKFSYYNLESFFVVEIVATDKDINSILGKVSKKVKYNLI